MPNELPTKYRRYIKTPRKDLQHRVSLADRNYDRLSNAGSYAMALGIRLARKSARALAHTYTNLKQATNTWKANNKNKNR